MNASFVYYPSHRYILLDMFWFSYFLFRFVHYLKAFSSRSNILIFKHNRIEVENVTNDDFVFFNLGTNNWFFFFLNKIYDWITYYIIFFFFRIHILVSVMLHEKKANWIKRCSEYVFDICYVWFVLSQVFTSRTFLFFSWESLVNEILKHSFITQ